MPAKERYLKSKRGEKARYTGEYTMSIETEYLVHVIIVGSWLIIVGLIAVLAMFWAIEMLLRKPAEHWMKKMLKAGKITRKQFDDFERYMWWNYGRHY